MDDRRPSARRQGRRHRARHLVAGRPGAEYGDALLPIRLDVTDRAADFAAVKQAHDHFGQPRHRGEQRRLRPIRVRRGAIRARRTRSDRNQRLWGTVDHPGRTTLSARAGQRPHHPGLLDRGHHRVPLGRHLPCLEVGAGRLLTGAGTRGRSVRCARHADRARAASAPTGPATRPSMPIRCRPTTTSAPPSKAETQAAGGPARVTRRRPRPPCSRSSTPKSPRCECF